MHSKKHEDMKGRHPHKDRACRADGGKMEKKPQESPEKGDDEWEEDEKDKPTRYDNAPKIEDASEERKHGGKAKKKRGGVIKKNVGGIAGASSAPSAARMPRKSGGRSGSDGNPFSSARAGTAPKGHKCKDID